jgi:hypothetical protein
VAGDEFEQGVGTAGIHRHVGGVTGTTGVQVDRGVDGAGGRRGQQRPQFSHPVR